MNASPVPCDAPALVGPLARHQLLTRLHEAVRIVQADPGRQLPRLRDLLTDLTDRVAALELPGAARPAAGPAQPVSHLSVSALAATAGEPTREFLLIPFGEVVVDRPIAGDSFVFTRAHAAAAKRWFERMGRKLAIDYEHQSFERCNTRPDGLRPAAGWIGGLEIRADGLWAVDVTWTERARELLRSGEYRYFSPVIYWTDEDQRDIAALGPVALTNDPAMRGVPPLAASQAAGATPGPDDARCSTGAGPSAAGMEAPPPGPSAAAGDDTARVPRAELDAARAELELLRQRLEMHEADTFVERGLRLGKILESTSPGWRADFLRDPHGAAERLAQAPVLLPPGRVIAGDARGSAARPPGRATAAPPAGAWHAEPEDLAAYARAAAAGRVHGPAVGAPAGRTS